MARSKASGIRRIGEGRYRVRVDVEDPKTGRRIDVKRIVEASSVIEAARLRENLRNEIARTDERARVVRPRLADAATSWLRCIAPSLKKSTADFYALVLDVYVIPELGDFYVDAITKDDIIALRDRWASSAKPITVNGRLRVLRQCMGSICDDHKIADPSRRVGGIRVPKSSVPKGLEASDAGKLLVALRGMPDDEALSNYALALLLATTGMRWGEASALQWRDVDFSRGVIRVERSHYRGHVDSTKTDIVKTVPLDPEVAPTLRAHRADQIRRQVPGLAAGLVFPSEVGTLRQPGSIGKRLTAACAIAGIRRITPKGFRHTMNNIAKRIADGDVTRAITGHVTEEMTEHYSWVNPEQKAAAVAGVVRLLGIAGSGT